MSIFPNRAVSQSNEIEKSFEFAEARQFDFWIGHWNINLRVIQENLTWKDEVKSKAHIYRILGGKAILELWESENIKGFSLRYFDTAKKKWVLYLDWPGPNQSSISSLEGTFRHGRGEFFSGSGKQLSRYTFCDITDESLRWDDAFSNDGGKTWTNNWIMEFSRTADNANWPAAGENLLTYGAGKRCSDSQFRVFEKLDGNFVGKVKLTGGKVKEEKASLQSYKILDGCAVISFMTCADGNVTKQVFSLATFNSTTGNFEELYLDNLPNSPALMLTGQFNEKDSTVRLTDSATLRRNWKITDQSKVEFESQTFSKTSQEWGPIIKASFDKQ